MKKKGWSFFALCVCFLLMTLGALRAEDMDSMQTQMMQMMQNMKKVMMMPQNQRMAYIMKLQEESVAHGKKLFNEAGPNGVSCSSCHPNGATTGGMAEPMPKMKIPIPTLVGAAATFPKFKVPSNAVITLPQMNNNCRMTFMKAKPYSMGSRDAADLAAYVSTFSNGKQVMVGKQSMMKMK